MILKDIIQRSKLENLMHIFEFKGCQGFYANKKQIAQTKITLLYIVLKIVRRN